MDGLLLGLLTDGNELLLGLQQLLVFFLVHSQVLVGVPFDTLLLVLQHFFLHRHELGHRVGFEVVEQMFQFVLEVLRIFVHHLWHHIPLLWCFTSALGHVSSVLSKAFLIYLGMSGFLGVLLLSGIAANGLVLFVAGNGLVVFVGCLGLLPVAGELGEVVEVGFVDEFLHVKHGV